MNIKKETNSQLSTTESKIKKISKQLEWEQNHRYGDHLEGQQLEWGKREDGEIVQGLKSIISRNKLDRKLRIALELEKPKNLYT